MAKKYGTWSFNSTVELDDTDLEHIAALIRQGYTSGQVVLTEDEREG